MDVLNVIAFKGKKMCMAATFTFDPRKNMQISSVDGDFNGRAALIKDQMISLHYFSTLEGETNY